ncbi:SDR family oxidoreductase [Bosea sp. (in: a-proteobacteria)]|uniref:SDR family oxidoreductase n=1 Tax=Bosea sp. (in: a-proteobacteria) TaxID=1871050 RepID=UPI002606971C|nr:SDR family oxidoreductase [Bosea sp. (in: a-proteobacteria)]MCO5090883.1 SDR family oxidoreductase [Bosea sp. (in: a-proteobacteria)]
MKLDCTGRRVLVTAAASGIGAEIAKGLAAAGARVHVCDIDEDRIAAFTRSAPGISASVADVSKEDDVARLVQDASRAMGGIDSLINNAGVAGPTSAIEDIGFSDWLSTYAVNVNGTFLCTRAVVPLLKAAGGGSIVNMASVAGRLGYPLRSAYSSSKWAVVGLTKTLAMELGPSDIRVNAILPGMVEGPRLNQVIAARALAKSKSEAEVEAEFLSAVSLRRAVTVQEVAAMVIYLLSPIGRSVSGQAISLDGNVEVAR